MYGYSSYVMNTTEEDTVPQREDFINVADAAQLAGKNDRTIRRWQREGLLKKYTDRTGGVWVDRKELERLVTPQPVAEIR